MPLFVSKIATNASANVANIETDRGFDLRYDARMLAKWLQEVLEVTGISQAEMARLLAEKLGRNVERAAVNKMAGGGRGITAEELLAIEEITGWEAPKHIVVPLKGRVGAGEAVYAVADDDPDQTVAAPAQTRPGTVAVEVEGDSMWPAYEPQSLLFYSKLLPPAEMINRRAIVQLADGRIFVKIVRKGSTDNTWNLESLNHNYPEMRDEVVEWAAPIDWVKPR